MKNSSGIQAKQFKSPMQAKKMLAPDLSRSQRVSHLLSHICLSCIFLLSF